MNIRAADPDLAIRESLQAIGEESFPEDAVTWEMLRIIHAGSYSFVESAPQPATVGYEKFIFVVRMEGDKPVVVGCYCREHGRWELLFTCPGERDDWKNLFPCQA